MTQNPNIKHFRNGNNYFLQNLYILPYPNVSLSDFLEDILFDFTQSHSLIRSSRSSIDISIENYHFYSKLPLEAVHE